MPTKYTKWPQNTFTKWTQNIPNCHKIRLMTSKSVHIPNGHKGIKKIIHRSPSKIYQNEGGRGRVVWLVYMYHLATLNPNRFRLVCRVVTNWLGRVSVVSASLCARACTQAARPVHATVWNKHGLWRQLKARLREARFWFRATETVWVGRQNLVPYDKILCRPTKFCVVRQNFVSSDKILCRTTKFSDARQNFVSYDTNFVFRGNGP
jgi:hypothetical protein